MGGHPRGAIATMRVDRWWAGPLAVLSGLLLFIIYVTWAAFQADHYYAGPYLSPLYSPVLFTDLGAAGAAPLEHAWLGAWPSWWPDFLPASPAFLILIGPAAMRFTCYYYRKAYYRAFVGSPPGCAVVPLGKRRTYHGESRLLTFQNLHRYAMYPAVGFVVVLYYDAFLAFSYQGELGIGVGSIVLLINATLIGAYTFGCHALRHLVGGHNDCMSCGKRTLKYSCWKGVGWLNARHQGFAWVSLIWVMLTDVYVRLVSHGIITDYNTW